MRTAATVALLALLVLAQALNGYALGRTQLYTPAYTYWLQVAVIFALVTAVLAWRFWR